MSKYVSYEQAGVNIDANDEMVERIQSSLASTFGPRVIALPGGFAGLFRLDYDEKLFKKNYKNPVLVACTDGVGSKVQLAAKAKKFDTVGIDLVAMSVNDMLVIGAEPLFFLDYVALHKLEPALVAELVKGIAAGCRMADCALIGGETAEMPDTYRKGDFDLAGFAVGVVERDKTITGKKVRPGDVILGLRSSGLHSNGYTLARNICFKQARLKMNDVLDELDGTTVGETLLTPTRIYVQPIVKLLTKYKVKRVVHAMAHITGGGLVGNIPRILPKDCNAVLKKSSWPRPKIFPFLQKAGPVQEDEMFRVFNMGIGYVLIVAADFADSIGRNLQRWGEKVNRIGTITAGSGKVVLKN
ncbi:MAG: phosphoribosylformylglycinamidine cyclo-ligase [Sedimentisphaerales bacterium]|jgi:phosphoribosylformylglycinamidine cyclo-ligase|nr:phosphoribosylformylglycinamidine cyclo-ligase [Sedimentisphaerales bacterium]NLT78410.1 phosphoribosylformylglycinamidine cyclo-ligase [Planctomycetota bacterium]